VLHQYTLACHIPESTIPYSSLPCFVLSIALFPTPPVFWLAFLHAGELSLLAGFPSVIFISLDVLIPGLGSLCCGWHGCMRTITQSEGSQCVFLFRASRCRMRYWKVGSAVGCSDCPCVCMCEHVYAFTRCKSI
jgi:hypothetical protein